MHRNSFDPVVPSAQESKLAESARAALVAGIHDGTFPESFRKKQHGPT